MNGPAIISSHAPHHLIAQVAESLIASTAHEPLALADAVLLLPSHRACTAMRQALQQRLPKIAVLPRIYPIGEPDEGLFWQGLSQGGSLLPAIAPHQRQMMIARKLEADATRVIGRELTLEEASMLARDVAGLMDELDREMIPYGRVLSLRTDVYAEHWQHTLGAVRHILGWWPSQLESLGLMNPINRRNALLIALAQHWQQQPPAFPVMAIGSTGSLPATALLLNSIAHLPQGKIYLPMLDVQADDALWQSVDASHPQWPLKHLLERLAIDRHDVSSLSGGEERAQLWRQMCLPAVLTGRFAETLPPTLAQGLHEVACGDEMHEAHAITLLMLEIAHQPGKTVALVTHSEPQMQRVAALLESRGAAPNLATGLPVLRSELAQWLQLVLEAAQSPTLALPWLALLKHPWCGIFAPADQQRLTSAIERDCLRGVRSQQHIAQALRHFATHQLAGDAESAAAIAQLLKSIAALQAVLHAQGSPATELWVAHLAAAETLAGAHWHTASWLRIIEETMQAAGPISAHSYAPLLLQTLSGIKHFPDATGHPRLHILSPIEARLQSYDRVILGDITEGGWPERSRPDAWLNEAMRRQLGLPSIQAQIGMQALDFISLASMPEVFITHARRAGGTDAMPSRWLQRLAAAGMALPSSQELCHWAQRLSDPAAPHPLMPPAPTPPASAIPRAIWVTQLEQWLRDPYGFYARHLLRLKALDAIDESPDAARFGMVLHAAWEGFVSRANRETGTIEAAWFIESARAALAPYEGWPQARMLWLPRLERMAEGAAKLESLRRTDATAIWPEQMLEAVLDAGDDAWTLRARIDRLEQLGEHFYLADYKTGSTATNTEIEQGYACQLPAAALIVSQAKGGATDFCFWKIRAGAAMPEEIALTEGVDAQEMVTSYREGLSGWMKHYRSGTQPFYAIPIPAMRPRHNDYEHLARTAEWLFSEVG